MRTHGVTFLLLILQALVLGTGIGIYEQDAIVVPKFSATENETAFEYGLQYSGRNAEKVLFNQGVINDEVTLLKLDEVFDRAITASSNGFVGYLSGLSECTSGAECDTFGNELLFGEKRKAVDPALQTSEFVKGLLKFASHAQFEMLTTLIPLYVNVSTFAKKYLEFNPNGLNWKEALEAGIVPISFDLDPYSWNSEVNNFARLPFGREWSLIIDDTGYETTGNLDFYTPIRKWTRFGDPGIPHSNTEYNKSIGYGDFFFSYDQSLIDTGISRYYTAAINTYLWPFQNQFTFMLALELIKGVTSYGGLADDIRDSFLETDSIFRWLARFMIPVDVSEIWQPVSTYGFIGRQIRKFIGASSNIEEMGAIAKGFGKLLGLKDATKSTKVADAVTSSGKTAKKQKNGIKLLI